MCVEVRRHGGRRANESAPRESNNNQSKPAGVEATVRRARARATVVNRQVIDTIASERRFLNRQRRAGCVDGLEWARGRRRRPYKTGLTSHRRGPLRRGSRMGPRSGRSASWPRLRAIYKHDKRWVNWPGRSAVTERADDSTSPPSPPGTLPPALYPRHKYGYTHNPHLHGSAHPTSPVRPEGEAEPE